mmetsp:Transcript_14521/g.29354  ORF Transcript_14521/g.29354 Transcript_14521/m.29354 type:complete len:238 (-) Transcript_14521:308-1021(-)
MREWYVMELAKLRPSITGLRWFLPLLFRPPRYGRFDQPKPHGLWLALGSVRHDQHTWIAELLHGCRYNNLFVRGQVQKVPRSRGIEYRRRPAGCCATRVLRRRSSSRRADRSALIKTAGSIAAAITGTGDSGPSCPGRTNALSGQVPMSCAAASVLDGAPPDGTGTAGVRTGTTVQGRYADGSSVCGYGGYASSTTNTTTDTTTMPYPFPSGLGAGGPRISLGIRAEVLYPRAARND